MKCSEFLCFEFWAAFAVQAVRAGRARRNVHVDCSGGYQTRALPCGETVIAVVPLAVRFDHVLPCDLADQNLSADPIFAMLPSSAIGFSAEVRDFKTSVVRPINTQSISVFSVFSLAQRLLALFFLYGVIPLGNKNQNRRVRAAFYLIEHIERRLVLCTSECSYLVSCVPVPEFFMANSGILRPIICFGDFSSAFIGEAKESQAIQARSPSGTSPGEALGSTETSADVSLRRKHGDAGTGLSGKNWLRPPLAPTALFSSPGRRLCN